MVISPVPKFYVLGVGLIGMGSGKFVFLSE
jgi:hypothetical protein